MHGMSVFIGFNFGLIATVILTVVVPWSAWGVGQDGYKHGQIDCMNGVVKYELKMQADNTTKWVKKGN